MVDQVKPAVPHLLAGLEALTRRVGDGLGRRLHPLGIELRGSHGRLLNLLAARGTRPSVLADGGWSSKQAVGKRIQELAAVGLVTVEPDPTDGRASIVRRTPEGDRVLRAVLAQIADLEAELRGQVGARRYETFRSVLDELAGDHLPAALLQTARHHGTGDGA